jgi:hypothetical protein
MTQLIAVDFLEIKYKDCFICLSNRCVVRNITLSHPINRKKWAVKHRLLDLVKRVPDEVASLFLKEISHEHLCWRQNP